MKQSWGVGLNMWIVEGHKHVIRSSHDSFVGGEVIVAKVVTGMGVGV